MKQERVNKIIKNMRKHEVEELIITSTSSIFYITGKWIEPGERLLVLYLNINGDIKLYINELFPLEDIQIDLHIYNDAENPVVELANEIDGSKVLGIDKEWPAHFLISLMEKRPDILVVNGSQIIDEVRMVKDIEEIQLMRESSVVNDKVMSEIIKTISSDYSERKICKILADVYENHGADGFSFYPLIAYGANAAEPHHSSDNSMVNNGDSIILDIGGRTNNYCSDMTRTVFCGTISEEYKKIYNIVLKANFKAIETVRPGIRFSEIDRAARDVITNEGYGEYFTHRTGHNIGIDVHEYPDVGAKNEMLVEEGMVFSIEPGIYLPGECGVRLEDLVVVTKDGCEVLNTYSKEIQTI